MREIAHCALTTFADKNILYPPGLAGAIKLEKDIVDVDGKNSPVIRSKLGDAHEYVSRAFLLSASKTSSGGDK